MILALMRFSDDSARSTIDVLTQQCRFVHAPSWTDRKTLIDLAKVDKTYWDNLSDAFDTIYKRWTEMLSNLDGDNYILHITPLEIALRHLLLAPEDTENDFVAIVQTAYDVTVTGIDAAIVFEGGVGDASALTWKFMLDGMIMSAANADEAYEKFYRLNGMLDREEILPEVNGILNEAFAYYADRIRNQSLNSGRHKVSDDED